MEDFLADPHTWAGVGLAIFIGILVYMKVPKMVAQNLDARSATINKALTDAEALRKEAEQKLADAARRRQAAEVEARDIVEASKREAAQLADQASAALADKLARRAKLAEERIARAEADAVREVKMAAVDAASKAAGAMLAESLVGKAADDHFAASLEAVRKALAS